MIRYMAARGEARHRARNHSPDTGAVYHHSMMAAAGPDDGGGGLPRTASVLHQRIAMAVSFLSNISMGASVCIGGARALAADVLRRRV